MDSFKQGWFTEISPLWPGQSFSLEVEKVLFHGRSEFQDILVFESKTYGRVLVLDGVIQCTERDECSYQEMMAHVPLFAHSNPKRVLVIGGGDGGVIREICKHPEVEEMVLCELDSMVIEKSKEFLPSMANSFRDPRLKVEIMDGAEYMKQHQNYFDVIIVDSSDPIGPADVLFEKPFYMTMKKALRDNGIVCTQGENMWLHTGLIGGILAFSREGGFKHVDYAWMSIPTYPGGTIGLTLCSMGNSPKQPARSPSPSTAAALRYYTDEVHRAAFALPAFVQRALSEKK